MSCMLLAASLCLPLCAQVKITQDGNKKVSVEIDGKPLRDHTQGHQTSAEASVAGNWRGSALHIS